MTKINPVELQKFLKGVDYPASKEEIVRRARENGVGDDVAAALQHLDANRFESPADVSEALGESGD
jgi:hypothetical protein